MEAYADEIFTNSLTFSNSGLICGRFWEEKKSDINGKETSTNLLKIQTSLLNYVVKIERCNFINREDCNQLKKRCEDFI